MVQEIESVQLVITHTAVKRLNSPKSGNCFSNDNFCFPWVVWKCLIKWNYFFLTNSLHSAGRVFVSLLVSGMGMSSGEAMGSSAVWPEGGRWGWAVGRSWGAVLGDLKAGKSSSEEERHTHRLTPFWVSSLHSSVRLCQPGQPQGYIPRSWVATVVQNIDTELILFATTSKKAEVYWAIAGFCQTCLRIA